MPGFLTGVIISITKNASEMCKVSRKQQKKLFRIGIKPTVCKIKLPPSQSFVRLDVLKSIQGPWMKGHIQM